MGISIFSRPRRSQGLLYKHYRGVASEGSAPAAWAAGLSLEKTKLDIRSYVSTILDLKTVIYISEDKNHINYLATQGLFISTVYICETPCVVFLLFL